MALGATISFGTTTIQVKLENVMKAANGSVSFSTLHTTCMKPVNEEKVCRACNEAITADNSISGYKVAKDQYIPVTEQEKADVAAVKSTVIEIVKWIEPIDPVWHAKTYWCLPGEIRTPDYGIMAQAIENTGMQGFGTAAPWKKQHPFVISAKDGIIYYTTLHSEPEFNVEKKPKPVTTFDPKWVELAEKAIMLWSSPLEEGDLVVTPDVLMRSMLAAKISGEEFVIPEPETVPEPVSNIQDALKETIALKGKKKVAA